MTCHIFVRSSFPNGAKRFLVSCEGAGVKSKCLFYIVLFPAFNKILFNIIVSSRCYRFLSIERNVKSFEVSPKSSRSKKYRNRVYLGRTRWCKEGIVDDLCWTLHTWNGNVWPCANATFMIVRDWKQSVFEEYFTYYYITVLGIYACISGSGILVSQIWKTNDWLTSGV